MSQTLQRLSERLRFSPYLNGFYDASRQWPDDIRRRVDAAVERAAARRRAVRTPHDALAYQRLVRERFWAGMGGLPDGPRDARFDVVGQIDHLGVEITRLVYESLPGVPVSALLYRRAGAGGQRPGVLFLSGHHETAKHHPEYQRVCLDLALHDLVVLAIDPWGQGERFQYSRPGQDAPQVASGTYEHSYCGLQCFISGGAVARYFAWDALRGVDLLAGLPDVDATRIGVTGNSGGGTQTCLLMMADERVAAAAPATYISGTKTYVYAGLPHDAEQNFVGTLAGAVEQADILASFAPRPLLVAAVAYDFFPVEATEQTVAAARAIYDVFGAGEKLKLAVDDDRHWYTDPLREHAVRFFTGELAGEARYERRDLPTLPPESLWCSPSGQLYRDRTGQRTVFDLNRAFLAPRRRPAPADAQTARSRLAAALAWPVAPTDLSIRPRYFPPVPGDGYSTQRFFFFAEPEVAVAGTMLRPDAPRDEATTWLVLLPDGTASATETLAAAGVLDLLQRGDHACVFDVRGRGAVQSHPTQGRGPDAWLGFETYNAYLEMLFDTSTVAARVFDVARAVEFLKRHEATPGGLALRGQGMAALWGYLAAALDEDVRAVHLTGMLPSWGEIVDTALYDPSTINAGLVIPGVLQHFDLPDLRVCFAGRALSLDSPLRVAALAEQRPLRNG